MDFNKIKIISLTFDGTCYLDTQGRFRYYTDYGAFVGLTYQDKPGEPHKFLSKEKISEEQFNKIKKLQLENY